MNQIINTNTITHDINNFKAVFSQDRKIIGLDVGKKTIGIAISDPISKIALTHKTIFRKRLKEDLQILQEIINDNSVVSIVIGLPLNKDGTKGPIAQSVITFSHILLKAFKLPILLWDERFSTIGILREMRQAGIKKKNIERNIVFLFQETKDKRVINFLKNQGFKFLEVSSKKKIGDSVEIQVMKHDFYDSSISIETPDIINKNLENKF